MKTEIHKQRIRSECSYRTMENHVINQLHNICFTYTLMLRMRGGVYSNSVALFMQHISFHCL